MATIRDGLTRKDVRRVKPGWVKAAIERCFTEDEIRKLVKSLEPKDQLDLLVRVQPKEVKVDQDTSIRLIINGLEQARAIDGHVIKALDEHDPAVDNSDD